MENYAKTTYVPCQTYTDAELQEYAKDSGYNLEDARDRSLVYLLHEGLTAPLHGPWELYTSKTDSSNFFFHNTQTGESQWHHPIDDVIKAKFRAEKAALLQSFPPPSAPESSTHESTRDEEATSDTPESPGGSPSVDESLGLSHSWSTSGFHGLEDTLTSFTFSQVSEEEMSNLSWVTLASSLSHPSFLYHREAESTQVPGLRKKYEKLDNLKKALIKLKYKLELRHKEILDWEKHGTPDQAEQFKKISEFHRYQKELNDSQLLAMYVEHRLVQKKVKYDKAILLNRAKEAQERRRQVSAQKRDLLASPHFSYKDYTRILEEMNEVYRDVQEINLSILAFNTRCH